jgi:hypothetical protein
MELRADAYWSGDIASEPRRPAMPQAALSIALVISASIGRSRRARSGLRCGELTHFDSFCLKRTLGYHFGATVDWKVFERAASCVDEILSAARWIGRLCSTVRCLRANTERRAQSGAMRKEKEVESETAHPCGGEAKHEHDDESQQEAAPAGRVSLLEYTDP